MPEIVLVSLRICPYFRICQYGRPRSESRTLGMGELTRAAGLGVENPQLLVTTTRRCENEMPPIGSPGRILILTFAGELLRGAVTQIDRPDLEVSILLLVCDRATVGRPVRTRAITAHAWGVGSEQLNVGAVRIHNINLRGARLSGDESDLGAVRAVGRRSVVRASANGDSPRRARVELRQHEVRSIAGPLCVQNRISAGLINRCDVETHTDLTDAAGPA